MVDEIEVLRDRGLMCPAWIGAYRLRLLVYIAEVFPKDIEEEIKGYLKEEKKAKD
jgi:hypothetical protein